ncbi:hypothetical protein E2C01_091899 [Portunus trituberculatus]|uniref:Uncharacterized protein n=1 Tax=Portunus trituberculatus TaxID=210409 RepID=A0A5B7JP82_PORTR|nr:hypothetical protein [Portunus trituberculatus]
MMREDDEVEVEVEEEDGRGVGGRQAGRGCGGGGGGGVMAAPRYCCCCRHNHLAEYCRPAAAATTYHPTPLAPFTRAPGAASGASPLPATSHTLAALQYIFLFPFLPLLHPRLAPAPGTPARHPVS